MIGKRSTFTRSKVPCEPTVRCTSHQGSASCIQDIPCNTVTASYLAVESSFAPSNPQGVLKEFLSPFHSTYDVEKMGEQNELPFHVLEKPPFFHTSEQLYERVENGKLIPCLINSFPKSKSYLLVFYRFISHPQLCKVHVNGAGMERRVIACRVNRSNVWKRFQGYMGYNRLLLSVLL